MVCKYCGEQVEEGAKFCSECGKELERERTDEGVQEANVTKGEGVSRKKWLIGIIGGICLISCLVAGIWIYRNNQLEAFQVVLKQYEQIVEESKLGKHQTSYEDLLEKAVVAFKDKKLGKIKELEVELVEAQSVIEDLHRESGVQRTAYEETKGEVARLILEAKEEETLEELLQKWQAALNEVDIEEGLVLEKTINQSIKELEIANQTALEASIQTFQQSDLSKAYPHELDQIKAFQTEIETLMEEGNYRGVQSVLSEGNELVEQMNVVNDNLGLSLMQVDTTEYPRVKLYLEIRDQVTGEVPKQLDEGFFYLSEKLSTDSDYMKQEIQKVVQLNEEENLNINIVADASGSMEGYSIESAKFIMSNFLEYVQFGIGDQVELIAFSDGVYPLIDFTTQKTMIQDEIQYLRTGNLTSLYDALFTAVNRTAIQNGAKCIIAFTDGMDNNSQCTPEEVINLANRYGIPIFIIGIGDTISEYELQNIASRTNGFYSNILDINDLGSIYEAIYRQQKELYVVEYETKEADKTFDTRAIQLAVQNRELGGSCEFAYTPNLVVGADQLLQGVSEIDDVVGAYLRGFVKAINNHDFSYLQDWVVPNSPLYKEVKPYVETKNITEKLLSYEIIEKEYVDQETCIVKVHETYEIQNEEDPLHLRILESQYTIKKQSDGRWQFYKFNDLIKILKKI